MDKSQQILFLSLYKPVHHQLCKFCRAISGNKEDAKDLMNDTILKVIEHFDTIHKIDSFKWYMFRSAINLNKMKIRRKKLHAEFDDRDPLFC